MPGAPKTPRETLEAEREALQKQIKSKSQKSQRSAATTTVNDENKENAEAGKDGDSSNIDWQKPDQFHLTEALLTLIEETPKYRQLFGFATDGENINSEGLKKIGACRKMVPTLFPKKTGSDIEKAAQSINNRIRTLKTEYSKNKAKLGQTGHGLVMEGRQSEIEKDTPIANAWDAIQKKFPWYKRLHLLLSVSPIYDHSAVANSSTSIDLDVLKPKSSGVDNEAGDTPTTPATSALVLDDLLTFEDDTSFNGSPAPSPPRHSSPITLPATPSQSALPIKSTPPPSAPSKTIPQKRKSPLDTLRDVNEVTQNARIRLAEIQADSKRLRAVERAQLKEKELRHQEAQRREDREHERAMLQMQIQLAQARGGQPFPPPQLFNGNFTFGNDGLPN